MADIQDDVLTVKKPKTAASVSSISATPSDVQGVDAARRSPLGMTREEFKALLTYGKNK